jgi:hypothetical protein
MRTYDLVAFGHLLNSDYWHNRFAIYLVAYGAADACNYSTTLFFPANEWG